MEATTATGGGTERVQLDHVIIRFAGDSGDGMQLTGNQFSTSTAIAGNDLVTLPDFPAEIRAPAGTLPGVSGFQIHFSSFEIHTPGGAPDVLVAMNPAALKLNLGELKKNGILIVNEDAFTKRAMERVGYTDNPLEDGSTDGFRLIRVPLTTLTRKALESTGLTPKEKDRSKNFFALGIMFWMYNRSTDSTKKWVETKFKNNQAVLEANLLALKGGLEYARATEIFQTTYEVPPAPMESGTYRSVSGNSALAMGFVSAIRKAGITLFQGSYPITPASDILHELSRYKHFGVITFQAEDEIAAVSSAIGASYAGALGITSTSGPGLALKGEAIGLAMMTELPLVVVDVMRAGPSTGMPTKPEQSDLLMALYGRHGESPMPVVAPATPGDCFWAAFEACRIAIQYMTPVILLSDGYLANGTEPFRIPDVNDLPEIKISYAKADGEGPFRPYLRDGETLGRPWAVPGTQGLEHRIGGLEKQDVTGNVEYDADNHEFMTHMRAEKINRVARTIPPTEVFGPDKGSLLILGWGGTYGAIRSAVARAIEEGQSVA
ncbi:MAG: 2-oxoacid:acceptor oxidoreductase subunit alpha, partial [Candidatus Eisenbacteria bacterium]|nr:2-oxoacid:acceptor oxidoreductase subunit alpha [Candidatus Eisenbacteria bacterium]